MTDQIPELPTLSWAHQRPSSEHIHISTKQYDLMPPGLRPPMGKLEDGTPAIEVVLSDYDGTLAPERNFQPTKDYMLLSYEQRLRTPEALEHGSDLIRRFHGREGNRGVHALNIMTGRACLEMQDILTKMGLEAGSNTIVGSDGTDILPAKWMWQYIDRNWEQFEAEGFKKVVLPNGKAPDNHDGTVILTYSKKGLPEIQDMLTSFNLSRQAESELQGTDAPKALEMATPQTLSRIAKDINEKIKHGDEEISKKSLMRGSSTYVIIENEDDRQALVAFAKHQGIRAVQSPHVSEVVELHGSESGKHTGVEAYMKMWRILLADPDTKQSPGMKITFFGNGHNDVLAANYLMELNGQSAKANRLGLQVEAEAYFMPDDEYQPFVDLNALHQGVQIAPEPHARGIKHILRRRYSSYAAD